MRDESKDRKPRDRFSHRTEFDFIYHVRKRALRHSALFSRRLSLSLGIGDDAALIRQFDGLETVITTDLLIEDVDFRIDSTTPWLLGFKALAVSLSDISAMGARPRYALISIGLPPTIWNSDFPERFYEGLFALAEAHEVVLIGGDVSRAPDKVVIDSIVLGEAPAGSAIRRSGARPGDHLFVTGALGGAAAGLRLLERGRFLTREPPRSLRARAVEELLLRQLRPQPRVRWGTTLGEERLATAMIDISDGLSSDLDRLCLESNVGSTIEASRIPVDGAVSHLCGPRRSDALGLALHGGEDFELLFTIRPRDLARLPLQVEGVPITYIGDVTREPGRIELMVGSSARTLEPLGFRHF